MSLQDAARWDEINRLFDLAADLDPSQRAAFLDENCPDPAIRVEVESLLDYARPERDLTVAGAVVALASDYVDTAADRQIIGLRLGPYKVLSALGRGGMGSVYLAERDDDQFRKRVAIKVVRRGMDTDEVLARFRHERQILAELDHPYIARLVDGGVTPDGRPYFAMDYVEGETLDRWRSAKDRPLRARLDLFLKVADAVAYAHGRLVVHRDLKPRNIMVTGDDTPRLLDFGVAKLLEAEAGALTATHLRGGPLTPEYASPEQVLGIAVTTATDVYCLGVVLYELLTGKRAQEIVSTTALEIDRVICTVTPPPPSSVADSPALRRALAGDIDNIVGMALRKEPERRYASVADFAADIRRHLAGRPVIARGDSLRYRAAKYLRRNRTWVLAGAIAAAALAAGAIGFVHDAQVRRRQLDNGLEFANKIMLDVSGALATVPGNVQVREKLTSASLAYLDSMSRDAAGDPALLWSLALGYAKLAEVMDSAAPSAGQTRQALAYYEKAFALARPLAAGGKLGAVQLTTYCDLLNGASVSAERLRDHPIAARYAKESVERSVALAPNVHLAALTRYSAVMTMSRNIGEAEKTMVAIVATTRLTMPTPPGLMDALRLATRLGGLADAQRRITDLEAAKASDAEAVGLLRPFLATGDARIAQKLAQILLGAGEVEAGEGPSLGNPAAARGFYIESVSAASRLMEADPADRNAAALAGGGHNLMAALLAESDPQTAIDEASKAAELFDRGMPDNLPLRATPRVSAAQAFMVLGRFADAERRLADAQRLLPTPGTNSEADVELVRARLASARGESSEASKWFSVAIAAQEALYKRIATPPYAWYLARALGFGADAVPASASAWRARAVEVWSEQDRLYPGRPYIEGRLAEARAHLKQ